jgi:hypothetical protein
VAAAGCGERCDALPGAAFLLGVVVGAEFGGDGTSHVGAVATALHPVQESVESSGTTNLRAFGHRPGGTPYRRYNRSGGLCVIDSADRVPPIE